MRLIFSLKCPKCKNIMNYSPNEKLDNQKKRCVFCNHCFIAKRNIYANKK
jgi:hypothetical protein